MRFPIFFLSILLAACGSSDSSNTNTAQYELTFTATWTQQTHPTNFPSNPHFSPLVGLTHSAEYSLWSTNETASPGVKIVAETGATATLIAEIKEAVTASKAFSQILAEGPINPSPGEITVKFDANKDFPYLSVLSMIAPSPDWFVGAQSVLLYSQGQWVEEVSIDLFAYDAGTDSGAEYGSQDEPTDPQEKISKITDAPFDQNTPLGTLKIKKL